MAQAKILVTGGAGYIGSHAVYQLLDKGYAPVVLDNLSCGNRKAIPEAALFIEGDVGDASTLKAIFNDHDIEAVIHFAASVVVPESVANPRLYYANNTGGTLTLLESMVTAGINYLVFSSTAAVYGEAGSSKKPITENTPPAPINPYGRSKYMSEVIISDMIKAHGLNAVILRYFNVAGAERGGRTGQSSKNATHLIKVASEVASGKRDYLTIFGTDYPTPDGTPIRDYIHVDDLISAHLIALDYLTAGGASDIFNCGYGRGYSVLEVIAEMEKVVGKPLATKSGERREGDPPSLVADSKKIRKILGWKPEADSLTQIISDAIRWEEKLK